MNILHITPTFYPATYWGGPIYSVYGLCNALARLPGVTLRVLTTDSAGPRRSESVPVSGFPMRYPAGYEVYFCRRLWAADIAPGMFLRLWPMIRWADVVHLTGVYSPPTIPTLLLCRLLGKPVVWSPRGALQRWERATKPGLKKVWEWICNLLLSPGRSIVHATSAQEENDSKTRITRVRFVVIQNGVEIPPELPERHWLKNDKLRLMYLGRLHPIKGIDNLLRAVMIARDCIETLEIYGDGDEAYRGQLQGLVDELGLGGCVHFRGHVDSGKKTLVFMQSDVCMVPSHTENFGMVVAESLAHGVPVVASRGTPWSGLEDHECGLWTDNTPESLAEAICRIHRMPLAAMGKHGSAWMKEQYSSSLQAARMYDLYRQVI